MRITYEPDPAPEENSDLNPQKQHETDLTREEKRRMEREKFKSMSLRGKLGYFWDYYKWTILIVIVAVVVIHEGIGIYKRSKQIKLLSIAVMDTDIDSAQGQRDFSDGLLSILGTGNPDEVIELDTSLMSGDSQSATIKRVVITAAGVTDIVIVDESCYERYAQEEAFLSWEEILGDDYESCAQLMDEKGRMDLTRSERWKSYEMTWYEPVLAGFLASSDKTEAGAQFAKYLAGVI